MLFEEENIFDSGANNKSNEYLKFKCSQLRWCGRFKKLLQEKKNSKVLLRAIVED